MILANQVGIDAHFLAVGFFLEFVAAAFADWDRFFTAFDAVVPVFITALPAARIGRSSGLPFSSMALRFSAGILLTWEIIAV